MRMTHPVRGATAPTPTDLFTFEDMLERNADVDVVLTLTPSLEGIKFTITQNWLWNEIFFYDENGSVIKPDSQHPVIKWWENANSDTHAAVRNILGTLWRPAYKYSSVIFNLINRPGPADETDGDAPMVAVALAYVLHEDEVTDESPVKFFADDSEYDNKPTYAREVIFINSLIPGERVRVSSATDLPDIITKVPQIGKAMRDLASKCPLSSMYGEDGVAWTGDSVWSSADYHFEIPRV